MIGTLAPSRSVTDAFARVVAASPPLRSLVLIVALAGAVAGRVALNGSDRPRAFTAGAVFGLALILIAIRTTGRWSVRRPMPAALVLGLVGGAALVALPGWVSPLPAIGLGLHPEPFAAWAVVTVIVAIGEEAVLRGVLFDAVTATLGRPGAVLLTSVAFALLHVPLYGWHVVPLDLAVGVYLGGLRLLGRGIAAPAVAHAVADLATWWL